MYLLGQLRGGAQETVMSVIPPEQNYSNLEKTLEKNFGLTRNMIQVYVMNLVQMPQPTLLATSLRHLYNAIMGDISSLEALKVDVTTCAPIIVPILKDRLPVKVHSMIGDCGKDTNFSLKLFTDSLKENIARGAITHS